MKHELAYAFPFFPSFFLYFLHPSFSSLFKIRARGMLEGARLQSVALSLVQPVLARHILLGLFLSIPLLYRFTGLVHKRRIGNKGFGIVVGPSDLG